MRTALFAWLALFAAQPVLSQTPDVGPSSVDEEGFKPDPNEAFVPATVDADGKAVVDGLNRFGLDLYGKLRSGNGDLAISPVSLSTAFGLAYAGAKGQTADQIAATLHYPRLSDFHGALGSVLTTFELHRNGRTLTVNNAIWLQDRMEVHPDYLALVDRHYGAGIQRADFKADSESARLTINTWVEGKTSGRIRNLLLPINVNPDTRSVLVNTIYFKADWASPFDKKDTREEDFKLASGKRAKRMLMRKQGEFAYAEGPGLKVLSMPYRGQETEMVIFLPEKAGGLPVLERSLGDASLIAWLDRLQRGGRVDVLLPKFKIENRFELKETLIELGMRVPFSNESDFSGAKVVNVASADREDWNLKINDVVHQVFVEVEEKGTEAAAATAIIQFVITGTRKVGPPKEFRADHPFLFLIRDRRTQVILFMGRFTGEASN